MSTLLRIDSSPPYGQSVSGRLNGAFVDQWKSSHPDGSDIGTAALNYGQDRDAFLAPHLQAVQTHAQLI